MGLCMGMSFVSIAEIIYYCARVGTLLTLQLKHNKSILFAVSGVNFPVMFKILEAAADLPTSYSQTMGRVCGLGRGNPEVEVGETGALQSAKVPAFFLSSFFYAPCLPWWLLLRR